MITSDTILTAYFDYIVWKQGANEFSTMDAKRLESDFISRLAEYKDDVANQETYRFLYSQYGKQLINRNAFLVRLKDEGNADDLALLLLSSVTRLREAMKSLDPQLYKKELGAKVTWAKKQHLARINDPEGIQRHQAEEMIEQKTESEIELPKIISGIQGLADYLGCSKGTAMKIVKSGILPSGKVQYKVGENWKFNRAKLDEFIAQNPNILGRKHPEK